MVITMPDGKNMTILDEHDFFELVEEYMGSDALWYLEENLKPRKEIHYIPQWSDDKKEVMRELRKCSETIANLICEKEIDRKALSAAAGKIGRITWKEINK